MNDKNYKNNEILDLALYMATSHRGVTIEDIMNKYEISHRTAQRWKDRVIELFPCECNQSYNDKKKYWKVKSNNLSMLLDFDFNDIVTLELLRKELTNIDKKQFSDFINKLISKVYIANKKHRENDTDIEAIMESEGFAVRQYPHFKINKEILSAIREAILAMKKVKITYQKTDKDVERIIHPYGILHSTKSYLVGYNETLAKGIKDKNCINLFALSKIIKIEIIDDYFDMIEGFNFKDYVNESFGVYHSKPMNVKLKFTGTTVNDAKTYFFHPTQKVTDNGDNVVVEFCASGEEAICWELFKWGNGVEILEPQHLKDSYKKKLKQVLKSV